MVITELKIYLNKENALNKLRNNRNYLYFPKYLKILSVMCPNTNLIHHGRETTPVIIVIVPIDSFKFSS